MDSKKVGPCGHDAIQKRIPVDIYASSLANEIPAKLAFSMHCVKTDYSRSTITYRTGFRGRQIYDAQHHSGLDFTEVRCENNADEACTMEPGSTWHRWSTERRIRIVTGKCRGSLAWHYILLVDDEETIQAHNHKQGSTINVDNYGKTLMSGWGENPSKDVRKSIKDKYHVNYTHYNKTLNYINY